jgi:hypothetical protein
MFVGRDDELAVLTETLARAGSGTGRLVLVSGEPGIGKTRLSEELCRIATSRDADVAWGRSWEGPGTPAYWPWLQVLRTVGSELLDGDSAEGDHQEARFRLFDSIAQALAARSRHRPLVIVLDDVHAADISTLLLLHFVARSLRGSRVLVIATTRDSWFHATPQTSELLAKIAREALHLPLGRLGLDDITRWMTEAVPHLASKVSGVFDSSEGNPLFVGELLAAAQKRPDAAWTLHQMPHGVREAVRAHLALLSEATARVLAEASIYGREMPASVDRNVIDEALALGIITQTDDGRRRFAHVMLRDELYGRLSADRRCELHRAAADSATDKMVAAHHHLLAARRADSAVAIAAVLAAMADASRRLAFEDAAQLGERAVEMLGPILDNRDECELRLEVAHACMLAGRKDEGFAQCARVSELADAIGDATALARAAIAATKVIVLNRNQPVVDMLKHALARIPAGDSTLRASVMAHLGLALIPPRPDEAAECQRLRMESIAMARRVGDDPTLLAALRLGAYAFPETLPLAERTTLNAEALALADRVGQIPQVLPVLTSHVQCLLESGDLDGAMREVAATEKRLAAFREPMYRWRAPLLHAMIAGLSGRFADADAHTRETLRIAREHDMFEPLLLFGVARCVLQYNRGDDEGFAEFAPMIYATQSAMGGGPYLSVFYAAAYDTERTRVALDQTVGIPLELMPGSAAFGWAAIRTGLSDHARRLYAEGREHFAKVSLHFSPSGCSGPSSLLLGLLASVADEDGAAEAHYRDALAFCERLRARPYIAQTQLAFAELLARRGARDEARKRADAAQAIADELGMRRVAQAAAAIADDAPRTPRARAKSQPITSPKRVDLTVTKRGDLWCLASTAREILMKDSKGLAYLEMLVRDPNREIHVLDLVGMDSDGDAGPQLDARAKQAYRERADELREELETHLRNNDLGRAERAREELDRLGEELARAVGLGGRDRRAASQAERARINVQRRLRDVIRRVDEQAPDLARHLELSLKTGLFCSYVPVWPAPRA